ncbi:hypothetical protein [uncultured Desulfobacter sp.]|uniref:hypothetical protein n=1 Tax=uncultured Desulfobacter sp. TaxID=240139 RepID=UPI0029C623AF|nr:hypothetical protein [uncultured Desulfobacter sp.]
MSKKKRITNRQAKIGRKKQKVKKQLSQNYSPKTRQKLSKDSFRNPLISQSAKLTEPPDGIKMSAVILKLAEPLLKKYGDNEKRAKTIISLTMIEWNKLLLPKEEQDNLEASIINSLVPFDGDAEDIGSLLYIKDLIAERKNKYFPDLKKIIVGYDLNVAEGNITLNISSMPIT